MQASKLERCHPALIRGALIAAALATYLFDRDDVVWRFTGNSVSQRALEHVAFLFAAVLVGVGATLCTWAQAHEREQAGREIEARRIRAAQYGGEWIYAIGLASLVPLWGAILLVAGELLRVTRLMGSDQNRGESGPDDLATQRIKRSQWGRAFRKQAAKWGILVTMLALGVSLVDRLADGLAMASVVLWALLNAREGLRNAKAT